AGRWASRSPASRAPGSALARSRRTSAAGTTTRVNTSRPYMVIGTPAVSRIAAASGSCQTLNSATGEAFPAPAAPPMNTIRPMLRVTSGWVRSSRAMLVSGAVGTRVTGRGEARISRRSRVTASTSAGVRRGAGRPRSPIPSWPWTWRAERGASIRGRSAPRATGTSPAPARSSTVSVLRTTPSTSVLPATQVTARRSIAGWRTANSSARASSTPVSQSMITGRGGPSVTAGPFARELLRVRACAGRAVPAVPCATLRGGPAAPVPGAGWDRGSRARAARSPGRTVALVGRAGRWCRGGRCPTPDRSPRRQPDDPCPGRPCRPRLRPVGDRPADGDGLFRRGRRGGPVGRLRARLRSGLRRIPGRRTAQPHRLGGVVRAERGAGAGRARHGDGPGGAVDPDAGRRDLAGRAAEGHRAGRRLPPPARRPLHGGPVRRPDGTARRGDPRRRLQRRPVALPGGRAPVRRGGPHPGLAGFAARDVRTLHGDDHGGGPAGGAGGGTAAAGGGGRPGGPADHAVRADPGRGGQPPDRGPRRRTGRGGDHHPHQRRTRRGGAGGHAGGGAVRHRAPD